MKRPSMNGDGGAARPEVDRLQGGHVALLVAYIFSARFVLEHVEAKLTIVVRPPALDVRIAHDLVEDRTRVFVAHGDGNGGAPGPEVDSAHLSHVVLVGALVFDLVVTTG